MQAPRPRLLIVDDDRAILTLVGTIALKEGFDVATSVDGEDALRQLAAHPSDLVLLDLHMPGVTGIDVLRTIADVRHGCRVVLMSGYATIDSAVEAVKLGAEDYFTKPFDLPRLRRLLASVRIDAERRRSLLDLEGQMAERLEFCGMIGRAPVMQDVFTLLRRLAPHARTALVTGETGTGKELAVRALHQLGPRGNKRFVTVNCSAVVETLSESELFGHARGAFTGAGETKPGLFEAADGGTLFLDEVGELPFTVQAKLLRVIENGEVQRVGSVDTRKVDVRLVAATNRDLRTEVEAGRFRSDLYYRLNVAQVDLPPLRDRREDIPYPDICVRPLVLAALQQAADRRDDRRGTHAHRSAVGRERPPVAECDRAWLHAGGKRVRLRARSDWCVPGVAIAQRGTPGSSTRRHVAAAGDRARAHHQDTRRGPRQQSRCRSSARHQPARVLPPVGTPWAP